MSTTRMDPTIDAAVVCRSRDPKWGVIYWLHQLGGGGKEASWTNDDGANENKMEELLSCLGFGKRSRQVNASL